MPTEDTNARSPWPTVQALALAAVPFVIALVGHLYTSAVKEREIQARMVELALAILQEPPDSATINLRSWAIRVVNQYSRVPLDSGVAADLRQTVPLPAVPTSTSPEAATSSPEPSYVGLSPGTPVPVTLHLPFNAHIIYRRWSSKQVVRELGDYPKGDTTVTLPYGGYIYFHAVDPQTHDTVERQADCKAGCSVAF